MAVNFPLHPPSSGAPAALCPDTEREDLPELEPAPVPRRHRDMLLLSAAAVLFSFALDVRPDQRVALRGLPSWPLPHSCISRALFGVKCPGCGLTRSFIHLAHGDWDASVATHRAGWLLALAVLLQFPYRGYLLRSGRSPVLLLAAGRVFSWFLIVTLVVNWLYDLAAG